jgi:hypothetical protein
VTQTHSLDISLYLIFKQNFALHYHDCFCVSTLIILPVTYTFRDWGFDQKVLIVSYLHYHFSFRRFTCSTVKATAEDFVSLSASQDQPSMTISHKSKNLHTQSATRYGASTTQRSKRSSAALAFSFSTSRTSFIPHYRSIFSKQENWARFGRVQSEIQIWSLCAKIDMPAKSRVETDLEF